MKSISTNEQEMQAEVAPSPDTIPELSEYIESLVDRQHDYGTCVYAMSLAAVAAFNHVAHKLGVTGFQASCADMDILTRTRGMKGPWLIVKGEDYLYPQYDPEGKLRDSREKWQEWLAAEAKKKLAEVSMAHPDVMRHWIDLAYPMPCSERDELEAKQAFTQNKFTMEFVEENVDQFKRFGLNNIWLRDYESAAKADSCKPGGACRIDTDVSLQFECDIEGIRTRWSIETEAQYSNGSPKLNIDFDLLARLEEQATNPTVKEAVSKYAESVRGK